MRSCSSAVALACAARRRRSGEAACLSVLVQTIVLMTVDGACVVCCRIVLCRRWLSHVTRVSSQSGPGGDWAVELSLCPDDGTSDDDGVLVLRLSSAGVSVKPVVMSFADNLGGPATLDVSQKRFVKQDFGDMVYTVPDACLHRISSSPLQHTSLRSDGNVQSAPHEGVPASVWQQVARRSPGVTQTVRSPRIHPHGGLRPPRSHAHIIWADASAVMRVWVRARVCRSSSRFCQQASARTRACGAA